LRRRGLTNAVPTTGTGGGISPIGWLVGERQLGVAEYGRLLPLILVLGAIAQGSCSKREPRVFFVITNVPPPLELEEALENTVSCVRADQIYVGMDKSGRKYRSQGKVHVLVYLAGSKAETRQLAEQLARSVHGRVHWYRPFYWWLKESVAELNGLLRTRHEELAKLSTPEEKYLKKGGIDYLIRERTWKERDIEAIERRQCSAVQMVLKLPGTDRVSVDKAIEVLKKSRHVKFAGVAVEIKMQPR